MFEEGTRLHSTTASADAVLVDGIDGVIDALARVLGETEVVVGAQVDGTGLLASVLERTVQRTIELATDQIEHGARTAADGSIPAIPQPSKEVARIEVLLRLQQRRVTLTPAPKGQEEKRNWT